MYDMSASLIFLEPVGYVLVARLLWHDLAHDLLSYWISALFLSWLFGLITNRRFTLCKPEEKAHSQWLSLKYFHASLCSISMTAGSMLVMLTDASTTSILVVCMFLSMASAITSIIYSAVRGVLALYNAMIWLPMSVMLLMRDDEFLMTLGIGCLVCMAAMLLIGQRLNQYLIAGFDSRVAHSQAVQKLATSKSKLEKALIATRGLAFRDELTGLYNRRQLWTRMEQEQARSEAMRHPLCFALMDLDHFKQINDQFGHPAGDVVLKTIAQLALEEFRDRDVVSRYGGEEFAVILPKTSLSEAESSVQRFCKRVAEAHIVLEDSPIQTTISIGVTQYRRGEQIKDTIARADQALYHAKRKGRNQVMSDFDVLNGLTSLDEVTIRLDKD